MFVWSYESISISFPDICLFSYKYQTTFVGSCLSAKRPKYLFQVGQISIQVSSYQPLSLYLPLLFPEQIFKLRHWIFHFKIWQKVMKNMLADLWVLNSAIDSPEASKTFYTKHCSTPLFSLVFSRREKKQVGTIP